MNECKVCGKQISSTEDYCGDYICQTVKTREELRNLKGILGEVSQLWENTGLQEMLDLVGREDFDMKELEAHLRHFIHEKMNQEAVRRFLLAVESIKGF